jgi:transcriptional regulator GlxA family with amidase domain
MTSQNELATRAYMSRRQFTRRFRTENGASHGSGCSPCDW